jgi:hypothetical protein
VSFEAALFPHLFPTGFGAATRDIQLFMYCRIRASQFFPPFTLYKPYTLLLYSLLMMHRCISECRFANVEQSVFRLRRQHPQMPEQELTRLLLRNHLPAILLHSPRWWSNKLSDLAAIVHTRRLPTFFITMTADEFSSTCFPEFDALRSYLATTGLTSVSSS